MKLLLKYNFLIFGLIFTSLLFAYINFEKTNISFDEKLREILFNIRGEIPTSDKVVIIDIDEESINALGQWPFNRTSMAQVIANLSNANAGIIGMDIIFSEKDRSSPAFMAKSLNISGDFIDSDMLLASVISQTPTIVGYYFTNERSKNTQPKSQTTFDINSSLGILKFENAVTNIAPISDTAYSSGFFNAFSDSNGKISKMPLILEYNNKIYPSLPLEMLSIASATQNINILKDEYSIYGLELNNLTIPTDEHGFMRINFRGKKKTFKYISFLDIYNGNFQADDIAGKFILIGTSITTLADLRATVYDLAMPGVEIHANLIDNILMGDFLYKPSYARLADIFIIFMLSFVLGLILLRLKSFYTTVIMFSLLIGIYSGFYYLLFFQGMVLNLFYPIAATLITTIVAYYINYNKEKRQKEFIKNKFEKKVSFEVVSELLTNEEDSFSAKEELITIFFSDIRGFTNISEKLNSPQVLINMLNQYLEPMTNIIINNKGTVDKFIGDAVMAYWNAPNRVSNHADMAVKSALEQLDALNKLNQQINKEFDVSIQIGIGIHTGIAIVGEMGSKGRSDYTVIGDNVNLASRIEGLTKIFGTPILISEATKDLLQESYNLRYVSNVIVKGKTENIKLYEVLSFEKYESFKKVQEDYTLAMHYFMNKEFEKSRLVFEKIEQVYPDKLNDVYLDKIKSNDLSTDFIMQRK